jgi:hypothetical protein
MHERRGARNEPHRGTLRRVEDKVETTTSGSIMALQRSAGNAAVTELITAQRDGGHAPAAPAKSTDLDERALAIIKAAQASTPSIEERAVSTVQAIIDTYYPDRKAMVKDVRYAASEPGLKTTAREAAKR